MTSYHYSGARSSRLERLVGEMKSHIKTAQDLAARAERENRDFTDDEHQRVTTAMRKAKDAKAAADQARTDEATRKAIHDLGAGIGLLGDGAPIAGDRRTKALGGTSWGADLLSYHTDGPYEYKALTPAGSINVTVPLAVKPVTDATPVYSLRQLIPTERDDTGRFSFVRQILREHAAGPVAAGARKPTSRYSLTRVDGRSVTIAHLSEGIPRQDRPRRRADAPGVRRRRDAQRVGGGPRAADRLRRRPRGELHRSREHAQHAGTAVRHRPAAQHPLGGHEARSAEHGRYRVAAAPRRLAEDRDGVQQRRVHDGAGGQGTPVDRMARRLWGIPVVPTVAVPAGTGYLADFTGSTKLWVREEANLTWSENTYDPNALGAGVGASDSSAT